MGKKLNLIGQQFGKLIVMDELPARKNGQVIWRCLCECGNQTTVSTGSLRSGNTKSCGCIAKNGIKNYNEAQSEKAKIPINTIFGNLKVIEDLGFKPYYNTGHNRRYYLCECLNCGTLKEFTQNQLKSERCTSCGCIKSNGEDKIFKLLKEHNIIFDYDTGFPDLKGPGGGMLRFDFIIYNTDCSINRCVEFDGKQHFIGVDGGVWSHSETLDVIQARDQIKNKYCYERNIPLVRIPYTKLKSFTYDDLFSDKYLI